MRSGDCQRPARQRVALLHERRLERLQARHAFDQQAVAIDQIEAAARLRLRQAGIDHGAKQQRADAGAGRAGAEHGDALLGERRAGDVDGAQQRADRDRGGALDVVVEGAQAVAIARQQPVGVADGEIFPVQQHMRPALAHRGDEGGDEVVVVVAAHALVLPADIVRIVQMLAVVGADVEDDRQRRRRMQAGAGGVERELADRDAHAAGALVAEAENALAVADDDGLDARRSADWRGCGEYRCWCG